MAGPIRTYALAERFPHPDFGIHDERVPSRIHEAHRHEYFQIQLNLAGETRHHIGAVERPLRPGYASFVLPYRVHRVPHPPASRFYVVSFTLRFLRPELDVDLLDLEEIELARAPELAPFLYQEFLDFALRGADLDAARDACKSMVEESARQGLCSMEAVRAQLVLLLSLVCRRHERELLALEKGGARRRSRRDALARVGRFVRENLTQRLTLADAAAAAVLSPTYLSHLLRRETGKTFTELVTERRMAEARELLSHTSLRVSDVARAVGFEDEAYFARRFRQWFGVSPTDARRKPPPVTPGTRKS